MKQLGIINPRNIPFKEGEKYKVRIAARAVVFDHKNMVALLYVSRDDYYKLPGGGVEDGEDMSTGLRRECLEEIGCGIEITGELGFTVEYWKEDIEKQVSYCYKAKVLGQKGKPNLTESEKAKGFGLLWVSHTKAIELLERCKPTQFEGEYIVPRELIFLREAGNL